MKRIIPLIFMAILAIACNKPENESQDLVLAAAPDTDVMVGDQVTFTLTSAGEDVTSSSVITESSGFKVEGGTWTPDTAGKYVFTGDYNGTKSNEVTILVKESKEEEEGIWKRVVIHKFTATWCGYCPNFTKVLNNVSDQYPDRLIVIGVHCGDDLAILPGSTLETVANVQGYPTGWIDHREQTGNSESQVTNALQESLHDYPAVCDIKLESSVTDNTIDITANIDFEEEGEYKVCAALMENNLYFDGTCTEPTKTYHHVLRQFSTDPLGDDLGTVPAGSKELTFQFKAAKTWNVEECEAVVYILKKHGDKYLVNNANKIEL